MCTARQTHARIVHGLYGSSNYNIVDGVYFIIMNVLVFITDFLRVSLMLYCQKTLQKRRINWKYISILYSISCWISISGADFCTINLITVLWIVNFIPASYYSRLFLVWHHWTPVIFESKLNSVSSCCFSFVLTTPGLVDAPFVNSVEYVIQHLYLRISDPTTQFDGKALPSIPFHTMVAVGW